MGPDAKNLMSGGNVQVVKADEVIDATQLTEGELVVGAGIGAKNTVVTGAGWLKVTTGGIAKCTQYGNNGMLSVNDGAVTTDIIQSEGDVISLSTLTMVNGRHPEDELNVDQGYTCGLLLGSSGNLRVLERHHAEKIIPDQEGGLSINGTTSAIVVGEGSELLAYPGGGASNCEINQGDVFILAGKADDTLLAGGTMNNLDGRDSGTIVENGAIYRLGTGGLQLYSSGKTRNLSVDVDDRAEVHADTLENAVMRGGTVILLSPTDADENFIVEEDRTPVELTGSVILLDDISVIIGYGADLQQSTIAVQQGGILIPDGNTVKGDSITFSVNNINLSDGKLWLVAGAATHMQLKVKRSRGEGAICLQTSTKGISPDFINMKGKATGDVHAKITDASRQTLCNVLKLQPDEDGIGAALQPA